MRLSWKIFFITTPIFVLFLTFFGLWMIQDNFNDSLDREVERCMVENQMFQNSYELTLHSLSDEQRAQASIKQLVESFHRRDDEAGGNARIYSEDGEVLYQDNALAVEHSIAGKLDGNHNTGYEIVRQDGETYLVVQASCDSGERIETTNNISAIYAGRSAMYARYQIGVLIVSVLVGGLILLALFLVMRNMQKLSSATRRFATGRYDARVKIGSSDEIGRLAEDFNWMANTMNRQMELSPEETDMCADYIFRQGKRLQSLSYKLLDLTMAGREDILLREIRAEDLLHEVERTVLPSLLEKQLTIQTEAQNGYVYGDRDLLISLFVNLIDNARKASDPGKRIRVVGVRLPDGYAVSVEDEGRGIPPEELSRITEALYMVDKSRARKEGGAGLGLALCQKIVELHQAVWQMESAPGAGLKVTVRFSYPEEGRGRRRSRDRRRTRLQKTGREEKTDERSAAQRI